jgi:hypothetical protein
MIIVILLPRLNLLSLLSMVLIDVEAYLDWEMTVLQKLNSHLVPEVHKVRQATSEFKDFAIVWWNELFKSGTDPQTWDRLKLEM